MVFPMVFARRSVLYLMSDMPQKALNDAAQAQVFSLVWHTALYLQVASLFVLGKSDEVQIAHKEGSIIEGKRNASA